MAQFFIHRPIFAWVIALVIMLAGILTLTNCPVSNHCTAYSHDFCDLSRCIC